MTRKLVLAMTGGGSQLIGDLLKVGGASSYFLEGIVPYDQKALERFLGFTPEKFVSARTARQMAVAAYNRGVSYGHFIPDVFGCGVTASLVKPGGEREGRTHEFYVACHDYSGTFVTHVELTQPRTRLVEEQIVAEVTRSLLCEWVERSIPALIPGTCDFNFGRDKIENIYAQRDNAEVSGLFISDKRTHLHMSKDGNAYYHGINTFTHRPLIYPGSFNPLHEGHKLLAKGAHEILNRPVTFEISVTNVDKPQIDFIDIKERLDGLKTINGEEWFNGVVLSNTPKFFDKVWHYGIADYLLGGDTVTRLFDKKYGDYEKLFELASDMGVRFYYVVRKGFDTPHIPPSFEKLFVKLPFDGLEISSRELRNV